MEQAVHASRPASFCALLQARRGARCGAHGPRQPAVADLRSGLTGAADLHRRMRTFPQRPLPARAGRADLELQRGAHDRAAAAPPPGEATMQVLTKTVQAVEALHGTGWDMSASLPLGWPGSRPGRGGVVIDGEEPRIDRSAR